MTTRPSEKNTAYDDINTEIITTTKGCAPIINVVVEQELKHSRMARPELADTDPTVVR